MLELKVGRIREIFVDNVLRVLLMFLLLFTSVLVLVVVVRFLNNTNNSHTSTIQHQDSSPEKLALKVKQVIKCIY